MKKYLLIFLCMTQSSTWANVKEIGKEEFKKEILASKNPVVVEFYSPDCPFCTKMSPIYKSVALDLSKKYTFLKVNTKVHPKLATEQKITSLPTFVFYKKEGDNIQEQGRTTGQMPYKKLSTAINKALETTKKAPPAKKK